METLSTVPHSTIDHREAAYYERLATTWWDTAGPFWPLHRLNETRVAYLRQQLSAHFGSDPADAEPLRGLHLLDIGCGGGILSESMAKLGASVHGVDVVEKNIRIAQMHADQQSLAIDYQTATAEDLAASARSYDAVLNMEVVEHVADLPLFLQACSALVRPGGLMVIATINRTMLSLIGAIVLGEYVLRWLPKGTHRWSKFPTPVELTALLATDGLTVRAKTGVRVNPLTRTFRLSRFTGINYMLIAHKPA